MTRLPCAALVAAVLVVCVPTPAAAAPCSGVSVGPATTVVSDATRDRLGLDGWPDTVMGVMREADGRTRFIATQWVGGAGYPQQRIVTTRGTLDDPVVRVISRASIAGAPPGFLYVGGGPVYRDPESGIALQVLHLEQRVGTDRAYTTLHLGRLDPATGQTRYLGPIASPDVPYETAIARNWNADIGTSSLTVADGYFRVYFPDYEINESGTDVRATSLSVARAPVADVLFAAGHGTVVPWRKYHNGAWSSPAIGGPSTALRSGRAPWHPMVARGAGGGMIMAAGISSQEMVLSSSPDGVTGWSNEVPLFREPQRFVLYPTLVDLGDDPAVLGDRFYLYYTQFESVLPDWSNVTVKRRLIRCTGSAAPGRIPLIRHADSSRHRVTTVKVSEPGMAPERGGVWYLLDGEAAGTQPVHGCRSDVGVYFASIDPGCHGPRNALVQTEGWIYEAPPSAPHSALYSCYFPHSGDYLVSIHDTCESSRAVNKGLLGYALSTSKVTFSRFYDGSDHWETTGRISPSYSLQKRWFLEGTPKAGTVPLYGCYYSVGSGVNHFISQLPSCEGTNLLRTEGWIHSSPPEGKPSTPLYRCYRPPVYDHFLADGADCEGVPGAVREGLMGYAETG